MLKDQCIFCSKCDGHYNLHVFNQNYNIRSVLYKWLFAITFVASAILLLSLIDASIKQSNDHSGNPLRNYFETRSLLSILCPILLIGFYFLNHALKQKKSLQKSSHLPQVEVLSKEPAFNISRLEAKRNLHSLSDTKNSANEYLFDKRWYQHREEQLIKQRR